MVKVIRAILKTLSTVFLVAVVLLAVLLVGIRLIGLTPYTVLSGSMEPTYHVGSVIYVKSVDPTELKAGDPITYTLSGGVVVTHRIEEVLNAGSADLSFRTKGDANSIPDGTPVPAAAVIGKPLFTIPYLGFVSDFVQRPQGLLVVVGVCAAVLLLSFAVEAMLPKEKPSGPGNSPDPEAPPPEGESP